MAINTLEFQTKLTGELDKKLVQEAQTSFFADTALRSKFVGARTVLIPDVDMQGLGNYDRDDGFVTGRAHRVQRILHYGDGPRPQLPARPRGQRRDRASPALPAR